MYRNRKLLGGIASLVAVFGAVFVANRAERHRPPSLHISKGVDHGDAVAYSDLPDPQRAEFEAALGDEFVEIDSTMDAWRDTSAVRYQGDRYIVHVTAG